nr:hypothetical protein [Tanacetum cinerariifolium]
IEEKVYVCQLPGFEDPDFPDRVYKVKKHCIDYIKLLKLGLQKSKTQKPLLNDKDGEEVDVHMYRSMIGSLMYLTSLRPDIMFAMCAFARYQVNQKVSHLYVVKRIFRDYVGASLNKKSTTGGGQFLGCITYYYWVKVNAARHNLLLLDGKEIVIIESSVRRDLQLADEEGVDCLPNSTIFEQLALMGHKNLKDTQVPQPSGPTDNVVDEAIHKELGDSLVVVLVAKKPWEIILLKLGLRVSKHFNGSLLIRGNTLQSDKDSMKLNELMELCTNLQNKVLDLEKTKTSQRNEINSLKRRVKKLKKRNKSRTHKLKRLYKVGLSARIESSRDEESLGKDASKQGRISAIDANEDITLVNDRDNEMFDVDALGCEEVFVVEQEVVSTAVTTETITTEEITLAQALKDLKTSKPKDKGKGIMIEEPVKPKKKDQTRLDEEATKKLQAKFGYKLKDLKLKEFDRIQEMFDREFRRVNTFEDFRPELVDGKDKRAGEELEQEIIKKQKVDDDKDKT